MDSVVVKAIDAVKAVCGDDVDEKVLGEAAKLLYDTCNKPGFIIDFDQIWALIGYSRKDSAKRKLLQDFLEGEDYVILVIRNDNSRNKGNTNGSTDYANSFYTSLHTTEEQKQRAGSGVIIKSKS